MNPRSGVKSADELKWAEPGSAPCGEERLDSSGHTIGQAPWTRGPSKRSTPQYPEAAVRPVLTLSGEPPAVASLEAAAAKPGWRTCTACAAVTGGTVGPYTIRVCSSASRRGAHAPPRGLKGPSPWLRARSAIGSCPTMPKLHDPHHADRATAPSHTGPPGDHQILRCAAERARPGGFPVQWLPLRSSNSCKHRRTPI